MKDSLMHMPMRTAGRDRDVCCGHCKTDEARKGGRDRVRANERRRKTDEEEPQNKRRM